MARSAKKLCPPVFFSRFILYSAKIGVRWSLKTDNPNSGGKHGKEIPEKGRDRAQHCQPGYWHRWACHRRRRLKRCQEGCSWHPGCKRGLSGPGLRQSCSGPGLRQSCSGPGLRQTCAGPGSGWRGGGERGRGGNGREKSRVAAGKKNCFGKGIGISRSPFFMPFFSPVSALSR